MSDPMEDFDREFERIRTRATAGGRNAGVNGAERGRAGHKVEGGSARASGAPKRSRFELVRLDDIEIDDGVVYLIDGLLPAGPAFGLTVGAPKSLKSFLLMMAGLCIAASLPFAGRGVRHGAVEANEPDATKRSDDKQRAVVYVTSEGIKGVERRLVAMRKALGIEGKNVPFFLVRAMPNLGTGAEDRNVLIAEIDKALIGCGYEIGMVVIDTVRRATAGRDENSAKDMGVYVQNCDAIAAKFQCLVMSVHHSPRSADGQGRGAGSNALDGAADVIWSVIREGNSPTATAKIEWFKDGAGEGTTWTFTLRQVEIGKNTKQQPIMSCTVDVTDASEPEEPAQTPEKPKKDPWLSGSLPTLKEALIEVLLTHGKDYRPFPDEPQKHVRAVAVERVRVEFLSRYVAQGDTEEKRRKAKDKAWERTIKDASQKHHVVVVREVEGVQIIWIARDDKPS